MFFLLADLFSADIDPDATVQVETPVHRVYDQLVRLVGVGHDGDTGVVIGSHCCGQDVSVASLTGLTELASVIASVSHHQDWLPLASS